MSFTVAELLSEVERHIRPSGFETRNALAGAVDSEDGTWTLAHGTAGVAVGSLLSVGLEDVYVMAVDLAMSAATVARGQNASSAAAHLAGDLVQVNPRASRWAMLRAVNDELRSLSSPRKGLYKVATASLTYSPSLRGYDVSGAADVIGEPLSVLADAHDARLWTPVRRWRFETGLDTDDFTSGTAIFLDEPVPGQQILVKYRTGFTPLAALTDDVAAVSGLPGYALNVLHYGAAIRLLEDRPSDRADTSTQGDPRRADEVTVSDTLRAPAALRDRYADELAAAVARLATENPVRLR